MRIYRVALLAVLLAVGFFDGAWADSSNNVSAKSNASQAVPITSTVVTDDRTGEVVSLLITYTVTGQVIVAPKETIDALNGKAGESKQDLQINAGGGEVISEKIQDLPGGGAVYSLRYSFAIRPFALLIVDARGYVQYVAL